VCGGDILPLLASKKFHNYSAKAAIWLTALSQEASSLVVIQGVSNMSNKPSEDSSRRNFLTAAVLAGAAVAAPTIATAKARDQKRGIYREDTNDSADKVADYSYTSDVLALLIVDMWLGKHNDLITPEKTESYTPSTPEYTTRSDKAKIALAERGIILQKPIVITEKEYVLGFRLIDAGLTDKNTGENIGVVFVLPRSDRAMASMPSSGDPPPLLESAKLLMAITPNGI